MPSFGPWRRVGTSTDGAWLGQNRSPNPDTTSQIRGTQLSQPDGESPMPMLRARLRAAGAPHYRAWMRFIECGGMADLIEFEAYLFDALAPDPLTIAMITHVVWELEEFGPSG